MEKEIARRRHYCTAGSIMVELEELVKLTPENDPHIVNVEISPIVHASENIGGLVDVMVLKEETLTDGSIVYNIDIY